ncbi:MAG: G8 domain-containing protein, partial [Planctomycetota bacterium]
MGATWEGGQVPVPGCKVQIRPQHVVNYDVVADEQTVIRSLFVAGSLVFATDKNTRLNVGLLKIEASDSLAEEGFDCDDHAEPLPPGQARPALIVGTPEQPVAANVRALIRLTYVAGQNKQSCPAIVCCGGRMDFHGAPLSRTWVKLGSSAAKGAREVTLAEPVTGWRVGDRIVLTATQHLYHQEGGSEPRTITAIDAATNKLSFRQPLDFEHLGEGEFRSEVANLSRNVVVESADPNGVRGHTMYHRESAGAISYAEFRHLGKKDTLGRYSLHFHLVGTTMRGSYVIGASIWDSHNRWLTIHGTNYLVVRDNVGYRSVGHGFFLEDGTEVYNVLDRNLAIEARAGKRLPKQVLPFDANDGAGFWWANSRNTFTRNVAAGCDQYGFRYEATSGSSFKTVLPVLQPDGSEMNIDIRTLPFVRFDDNEVHSSYGLYGINLGEGVQGVGPDARHPFILRNTKIWNVHYGFRPQAPSVLVDTMKIQSHYGIYHPNFDNHHYRNITIRQTNTEPFNRGHDDLSVQHGMLTVDGLTLDGIRSGSMPLIQISDDNATGAAVSHFRGLKLVNWMDNSREKAVVNLGGGPRPKPSTEKGVPIYLHDWYGPGRHAMVVSRRSPEYLAAPNRFRADPPLTGDESRVAEVNDLSFPQSPAPIDDLPPTTVSTHVTRQGARYLVQGTCADNGEVRRVVVNGQDAEARAPTGATWALGWDVPGEAGGVAGAEDAAGVAE